MNILCVCVCGVYGHFMCAIALVDFSKQLARLVLSTMCDPRIKLRLPDLAASTLPADPSCWPRQLIFVLNF